MRFVMVVAMLALLGVACGLDANDGAFLKQTAKGGELDRTQLFYPFPLRLVSSPIRFRPDYDSGVDFSIEYSPTLAQHPLVIRTFYSNSRGYRSEILFNLKTGSLTVTDTQMGVTHSQELAAPRLAIRDKAAYLQTLDTLIKQVTAICHGDGIDHSPVEDLAIVESYLQKVREVAAASTGAFAKHELFYPYALDAVTGTLSYQPDYDSRVVLTVDYLAINDAMTPVIQSFYDNSNGYHSKIVFLLSSGVLRLEEGALNNTSVTELPPPAQEPTAKTAYVQLLTKLAAQVQALENGSGIRPEAHPELAKTSSYLQQVLSSL